MSTRAVHFDGHTELRSVAVGFTSAFATSFGCGIFSYWTKGASVTAGPTVFLAYSDINGHCLRVAHFSGRPTIQVQDPRPRPTKSVIFDAVNPLPIDDRWHNVCFGWNVNVDPPVVIYALDSARQTTTERVTRGVPFEVDYSIADIWTIGAEDITATPIVISGLPPIDVANAYEGDLAELYLSCNQTYVDILKPAGFTVRVWIPFFGTKSFTFGGKGFTTPDDKAMKIGPDGSGATGWPPQIYCSVDPDSRVSNTFEVNRGTANRSFVETGTLASATSDHFP